MKQEAAQQVIAETQQDKRLNAELDGEIWRQFPKVVSHVR